MPYGTAMYRLRKSLMFELVRRLGENVCYRCEAEIEDAAAMTIEHKEPWENRDAALFWDLGNIAFSHSWCNVRILERQEAPHGSRSKYENGGCRCDECRRAHTKFQVEWRRNRGR